MTILAAGLYRIVAFRSQEVLAVDAVDGEGPGPHHDAVPLLAGEVAPALNLAVVFS